MDLLNTLGKKDSSVDGVDKSTTTATSTKTEVNSTKSETAATAQKSGTEDRTVSQSSSAAKEETSGDQSTWTLESALKEIGKLREENKHTRIKYSDTIQSIKQEMEARDSTRQQEVEQLKTASKELEELKEKEADKKRDLTEKVSHREALLAEYKMKLDLTERKYQSDMENLKVRLGQYEAEKEAQNVVQKRRLDEELASVPEKYKEVANLIVKGAGSPADALLAISEAKVKGVFEDKTIVVNHSVPGAHNGARTTKDRLEAADKDSRSKMTSQQKIGQALKDMKVQPNTAFRTK